MSGSYLLIEFTNSVIIFRYIFLQLWLKTPFASIKITCRLFSLVKTDTEICHTCTYRLTVASLLWLYMVHWADVGRATLAVLRLYKEHAHKLEC